MKTHAEIDALYRATVTHSHDAAIDAVYLAGAEDALAELRTATKLPADAPMFAQSPLPAPRPKT